MSRRVNLIITLTVFLLVGTILWQRQSIYDWYRLRNYQAPAEIAALVDNTTMLPYAERIFLVHHPELEDKTEFNQNCGQTEHTIILGCYISNQGIYLFDITDKRLQGIEEVTAAHEMLHAAYDRLSPGERAKINGLLQDAYADIDDERIRLTIDNYQNNGADVNNELHSILGTEVRKLPDELEAHYKKYFSNRQKIVDYSERYEGVFLQQKQRIDQLDKRIDEFEAGLQAERAEIEAEIFIVNSESARLDSLRSQNRIQEYNAAVPGYNNRANVLNQQIEIFNASLDEYRALIEEYNSLAQTQRELNDAIDSRITSPTTR